MRNCLRWSLAWLLSGAALAVAAEPASAELIETRRIWDQAPHSAFTDLVRFHNDWYCVFREGKGHVSPDGALRVITSSNGLSWTSAALLTATNADLRDPKITVTPEGKLMLTGAGALHQPAPAKHQTFAWFSEDGRNWTEPVKIGDPNLWLWRVTWRRGAAYSVGYDTTAENFIRLYSSKDGQHFDTVLPTLFAEGHPNETSLVFLPDESCLCLLRRDGEPGSGKLGVAKPPYKDWTWKDLGRRIGGPHALPLPDGRIVAAARLYDGGARTALLWLDAEAGKLTEFLKLPSGGDTSYPGLVWHEGLLWVSYYSSHEGKTSIYLAKVRLPPAAAAAEGLPAGARALRDLEYVAGGHERQKLDLYLPAEGANRPVIVWVHGGAWQGGSKERCPALPFLRQGYAVASVNYRLSQHALFPAQLEDCKAALRWLRAHAKQYQLDPDRFGVWGASAGGHLVALLGTTGGVKEFDRGDNLEFSSRVQAVCDFFGPTDLTQMSKFPSQMDHDAPTSPESRLLGGPVQDNKDKAARANPITYVSKDAPPFLIMHGDNDQLVPLNQSELLHAALTKVGAEVTFQVIKGAGHGFGGPEINRMVSEFFAKHLQKE